MAPKIVKIAPRTFSFVISFSYNETLEKSKTAQAVSALINEVE